MKFTFIVKKLASLGLSSILYAGYTPVKGDYSFARKVSSLVTFGGLLAEPALITADGMNVLVHGQSPVLSGNLFADCLYCFGLGLEHMGGAIRGQKTKTGNTFPFINIAVGVITIVSGVTNTVLTQLSE